MEQLHVSADNGHHQKAIRRFTKAHARTHTHAHTHRGATQYSQPTAKEHSHHWDKQKDSTQLNKTIFNKPYFKQQCSNLYVKTYV
jgi:hypothetical protein